MNKLLGFILLALTFAVPVSGQKYDWKRGILRGSTFIVSGGAVGLHEAIRHPQTYQGFKRAFPNADDSFWNPEVSWKRKYDNPYPLSRTFPVFTDAYHLTNAIRTTSLIGATAFVCIGEKRPWWHYAIDLSIGAVFYGIGSNLTYEYFKFRGQ